jgi:ribosomal protein S18 acetylase RimI-like enzyme
MELRSLTYRTDLIFARFDGEVIDRGGYLVIQTPSNPTFHWGNFLLFAEPPELGDFERWRRLFAEEIGVPPHVTHQAFGWDGTVGATGEVEPFLAAGFRLNHAVTLTATAVTRPAKYNDEVVVRPIEEDWEWEQALANQIACRDATFGLEGYTEFKARQMRRYREMARAGLGAWFGAFLGERLVADLGLYREGDLARFQQVETHPDFRRRGICGALVHQAALYGFEQMGARTLVIVADENYHAARIYETVGFRPTERSVGMDLSDH